MAISRDRFRKALNDSYSKENLFKIFKRYFLDWIAEGYIGSNLGLFEISLISETTNKQTFLELMEQMYSKEETFISVFESLSKEVKEVFEEIAWKGKFKIKNRDIYLKEEEGYNIKSELKDEFLFFSKYGDTKKGEYLTLDNDIVRVMRKFLKKPKEYFIYKVNGCNSEFKENNEEKIQENLRKYYSFFKDGKMQLSSSGKLLKESKNNMKKYCNINEYYEGIKDLEFLKTETMGLFLFLFKDEYLNDEFIRSSNLKEIVNGFLDGTTIKSEDNTYISLYLNYLKGIKNVGKSNDEVKRGLATIKMILNEFPDDGFVSIDNIIKSILYRDEFIEIIDVESAYGTLYINEANYERTKIVGYEKYLAYVVEPFIKSVFFILASLGVLEICYEKPSSTNALYLKNGYLSKYDGIKYVGFTELGKYIFNRINTYNFKVVQDEGKVILEDDRLIVTVIGESPLRVMCLEKFGTKIAPNKFKLSEESMIKGLENRTDIQERVQEFKEKITNDLPENWLNFFESLLEKTELITHAPEYKVLKLKNDKGLISAITKDKRFKPLILKGEDLHIIVKKENLDKVSGLFKEYGYFVNI
ncbi:hypothetical protein H5J22_07800 [Cetobacterium sp. 8H]|uniref:hypothetical protein n=1 Tax=Cetobacterium sp. 8H TaxID=2759681 RepID=UPI00163CF719|nr:hypothetical protein [Cetobacterium sp. 8H]MBC2851307.1 hypothetical protein [Cetobacterium sp. 8H]